MDGYDRDTSLGVPINRISFQDIGNSSIKYTETESTEDQATWSTYFRITEKDYGNQRITCDYEQRKPGQTDYSKSIELFFEIYKQSKEEVKEDSKCLSTLNCEMTLSVLYQGGQNRNELVFNDETLEKQALRLHRGGQYTDESPKNQF